MIGFPLALSLLTLAIWINLILFRGQYWRERPPVIIGPPQSPKGGWPAVVAVVPARDEADVIGAAIGGLLRQDYPGAFSVILVDDQSADGTADLARAAAGDRSDRLTVIPGQPLPPGWVGKMWAVAQGVEAASRLAPDARYLLLTDADIGHEPGNLAQLVARAEAGDVDLVSQMVKLHCGTLAERFLIPAFVHFFAMLYPFAWVNDRGRATAAAAGGSMLVRREALEAIGGMARIKDALIDDCALAAAIKSLPAPRGRLHLSLTDAARSLRPYASFGAIGRMVSRSAYTQLNYSPLLLAGTVLGMIATYGAPVALALGGDAAAAPAILAYALMVLSFGPILEVYALSPLWALALPAIATCYLVFTIQSAVDHMLGRGGRWKGRIGGRAQDQQSGDAA